MNATEIENVDVEGRESGLLHRTFAAELTAGDGRTVDVRIVPYGERITHNDGLGGVPKGVPYQEEWLPGVFDHQLGAAHRVVANIEHEAGISGMVARSTALHEARDGFHGSFRMLTTVNGDAALELIREGVFDGVSLEAKATKSFRGKDGVIQRAKANLFAIAFTRFAAFEGARVLAVREEAKIADIDEKLLPVELDPELIERCRRLGIKLPQRYEAHPDDADTPAESGTSDDGTRLAEINSTSEEE